MGTKEYYGTPNADKITRSDVTQDNEWSRYSGKEGDDDITWWMGEVSGGPGNDRITQKEGANLGDVWVIYWDNPAAVYVDLEAGYAIDGWGTRDTLVNIHNITASGRNDKLYGSSKDDKFSINWGQVYVDGRDGFDQIDLEGPASRWTFKASADGRTVIVTNVEKPTERVFELHNIEKINFWTNDSPSIFVKDLINLSQVGPEALVESNTLRWNVSSALGSAVKITYSFTDLLPSYGAGNSGTGAIAWNADQKVLVRQALAMIESQTQISFQEVSDGATSYGQMRFGINQQANTTGYSFLPDKNLGDLAGDVWLSTATASSLQKGNAAWMTLLREISHSLGLKTPFSDSYTGSATILIKDQHDTRYTVMSPNDVMNAMPRENLGMHDLSALRYLYGKRDANTGNNQYVFTDANATSQLLIVDDGGVNTIDASKVTLGARIDLRPGMLSSIGRDSEGAALLENITLAVDAKIDHAIGTQFDDILTGNISDNTFNSMGGNDQVDGDAGNDSLQLPNNLISYDVYFSDFSGDLIISSKDGYAGTVSAKNIETLKFSDSHLRIVPATGTASDEHDLILASNADNQILAGKGDDVIYGNQGNDAIDGGTGKDIVAYHGTRGSFLITKTAGTFVVSDVSGPEGKDTIVNAEQILFSDMHINLTAIDALKSISSTDLVALEELYIAFFNRIPDATGLAYWAGQLGKGLSMKVIAESFYAAAIYFSDLTGYSASMTNDDFVKIVYKNVLGRSGATAPPDADVQYWSGELAAGRATKASLISTILVAAHSFKGDKTWGWVPDLLDNKVAVANFFAVQQGLNYNTDADSIAKGMAIAAAVTSTDTSAALKLIGVSDIDFNLMV